MKDETGEIKVAIWNHEDLKHYKGKKVTISSYKSEKHGLVGVEASDTKPYTNKAGETKPSERIIKVTKTGNVDLAEGETHGTAEATSPEPRQSKASVTSTESSSKND
jgi:hypothetical protein